MAGPAVAPAAGTALARPPSWGSRDSPLTQMKQPLLPACRCWSLELRGARRERGGSPLKPRRVKESHLSQEACNPEACLRNTVAAQTPARSWTWRPLSSPYNSVSISQSFNKDAPATPMCRGYRGGRGTSLSSRVPQPMGRHVQKERTSLQRSRSHLVHPYTPCVPQRAWHTFGAQQRFVE